jgi:hypothetical protein
MATQKTVAVEKSPLEPQKPDVTRSTGEKLRLGI